MIKSKSLKIFLNSTAVPTVNGTRWPAKTVRGPTIRSPIRIGTEGCPAALASNNRTPPWTVEYDYDWALQLSWIGSPAGEFNSYYQAAGPPVNKLELPYSARSQHARLIPVRAFIRSSNRNATVFMPVARAKITFRVKAAT